MPSWIVHLATATEVIKTLKNVDKNSFLIGNLIPDAERFVIDNFSVVVPYNISHFSNEQIIDGKREKLPNIDKFMDEYRNKITNPMVLGYLSHLLTDFYWNKTAYFRYTIRDEEGFCIGVRLNSGKEVMCTPKDRLYLKYEDFNNFTNYVFNTKKIQIPYYDDNLLNDLKDIKEIPLKKSDIQKIIEYINNLSYNSNEITDYKLFTKEQINLDYKTSIKFIIDYLKNNTSLYD